LKSDKAAKDITFEVFEDDIEKKDLRVVEKIVGKDVGGRPTIQTKDKGIEIKRKIKVTNKDIKSYKLKQIFSNKIVVRDEKTRVKSESTDVSYPVMIDADVEVSIGNTADDGVDSYKYYWWEDSPAKSNLTVNYDFNHVVNVYIPNFVGVNFKDIGNAFTRFDGITIPQSATIDDATLNLYAGRQGDGNQSIKVYAFDENDPDAPTAPGDLRNKIAGIAFNVATIIFTNYVTKDAETKGMFDLYNIDVSDIVQELVNNYDYNNEAMLFFYRSKSGPYTQVRAGPIYDYTWGSTKTPELIINYTEGGGESYRQKLMIVTYQ